jgi:hypothetical protein
VGDTFRRKGLSRLHLDPGPVRPGEELSLPSLADWLRGRIAGAERGIGMSTHNGLADLQFGRTRGAILALLCGPG